jgi:hypothetical protein
LRDASGVLFHNQNLECESHLGVLILIALTLMIVPLSDHQSPADVPISQLANQS